MSSEPSSSVLDRLADTFRYRSRSIPESSVNSQFRSESFGIEHYQQQIIDIQQERNEKQAVQLKRSKEKLWHQQSLNYQLGDSSSALACDRRNP
jgi:hypothetical protein